MKPFGPFSCSDGHPYAESIIVSTRRRQDYLGSVQFSSARLESLNYIIYGVEKKMVVIPAPKNAAGGDIYDTFLRAKKTVVADPVGTGEGDVGAGVL